MLAYVFLTCADEKAWPWADHGDAGVVHGAGEICGGDGILQLQDDGSDVRGGSGGDLDNLGRVEQVHVAGEQDELVDSQILDPRLHSLHKGWSSDRHSSARKNN